MKGSLRLVLTAMQEGNISTTLASAIVDELILNGKARFPFRPGEFVDWVQVNGLA